MKQARKRSSPIPCPSCGYDGVRRTDRVDLGDYGYLIQCPRCKLKGSMGETVDEAVENWNAANAIGNETEVIA